MIVIADAGPLLHLHWVDALGWALPPQNVSVVASVWREVEHHAPEALRDARLQRVPDVDSSQRLHEWRLDGGEEAALSFALAQSSGDGLLILCDELRARQACRALSLPVIGSVGLMIEAHQAGRVSREITVAALRELPTRGRLHIREGLIAQAIAAVNDADAGGD